MSLVTLNFKSKCKFLNIFQYFKKFIDNICYKNGALNTWLITKELSNFFLIKIHQNQCI